jgi:hypothetical protein
VRAILSVALFCSSSVVGATQVPNGRPLPADPRERAAVLVNVQLTDTSFIQRSVALNLLRTAPADVRSAAAQKLAAALAESSRTVRTRALDALGVLGPDAEPVLPTVVAIVRDSSNDLRRNAIGTLGALRRHATLGIPALREVAADRNEGIRLDAADALLGLGDSLTSRRVYLTSLRSTSAAFRLYSARMLAALSDSAAVPVLRSFLSDTLFPRWSQAATALGVLGPKAIAARSDLIEMVRDTTLRRIPQGTAWVLESRAPYAAWALSQIIPFRSSGGGGANLDPVFAFVEDNSLSLRDDGLGVYAWGVDSVAAWRSSGFFLVLAPSVLEARGPIGPERPGFRRSLLFDLSAPVPGTGAVSHGVVRDHEAYIWIWYRRDPRTDQVRTFRELTVSDSVHDVERIEMHFRVNGILHVLQMGPFVEGQGGGSVWQTGLHGNGTTMGTMLHPSPGLWIVRAPEGSLARLWSFEDRAHPVDRGLYSFSLQIRFALLPGGANGACVATPSTCAQLRP